MTPLIYGRSEIAPTALSGPSDGVSTSALMAIDAY
jgi:hypothetical protein